MKYCLQYANSSKLKNVAPEISILYDRQDTALLDFIKEHIHQRIILIIDKIEEFILGQEWQKLNAVHDAIPEAQLAVCFYQHKRVSTVDDKVAEIISKLNIPFFTGDLITTWDQLHYFLNLGVSDVYLAEDICFKLDAAKALCSSYGVQVRIFPNVAQSSIKSSPALKKFFIRPEDLSVYEPYVDIVEFWGPLERQDIYHHIYFNSRQWFGDLNEIIFDLNTPLDSRRIVPIFAPMRVKCDKKCMKNGKCRICDRIESLSHTLADKELIIKTKKQH